MRISFLALSCTLALVIGFGARKVTAAPSDSPSASPLPPLSAEEIVTRMVEKNLTRARALAAYQGTRVYRLEYSGFLGSRSAEIVVDVRYRSPGTKEFNIRS